MGILKSFFQGSKAKEVRQPFVSTISSRFQGLLGGNVQSNYLEEYKNWVFACINARSEDVGSIQLKLMKNGEEVTEHPILDLINKVNPYMTKHGLLSATQAFKDLDGNAYWYLAREGENNEGDIKEIYLLRPDRMRIVLDKDNPLTVKGYIYRMDSKTEVPFEAKDILHHKNFNPFGNHPYPHKGMGIVQAASWAIDTDNEARQWNYKFFKNSAKPDGILYQEGEGVASTEEHKRLEEEWDEKYKGSDNAHKTLILSGGVKWQELTRSQKDMDFINQRTFSRDEILALFRTPKSILGITDDVNRANADASIYVFALRTIKPLMQQLVDTLNEFLLPTFGDDALYFDFVSPVPEDRAQKTSEYTQGINKWLSRNEIRAMEGLPPTQNGDEFQGSFADVTVDKVSPQKSKTSSKPSQKIKKGKISSAQKLVDDFVGKLPHTHTHKSVSDETRTKYIEIWNKNIDINMNPLKKKLTKFFEEQKKEVLSNLNDEFKGLEAKEYHLKALSDVVFDNDKAVSASISLITPFIRNYIKQSGQEGSRLVDNEFDDDTPDVDKFVKARAKYFADTINETTSDDLVRTLKEGTDAGESMDELKERIATLYDSVIDYRVERIARTEISASANFGAVEAYKQAGVEKIQWQVVNPEDEDCLANDGEVVSIGNTFSSGDEYPPVHPNCVCTTIPIF